MLIRRTIIKEYINGLEKAVFSGHIYTVNTPEETEKAIEYLKNFKLLGIDTETRPSFSKGHMHKVALLQISTEEECFLFRLNLTGLTLPIIQLLENPDILKIGVSLHDDLMMMHKRAPFEAKGIIELQTFVKEFGIQDMSLQKIYANIFNQKISKSQRLSNWEANSLSESQKQYAAMDAWACLKIYTKLTLLKESGDWEPEPEPVSVEEVIIETSTIR
ncbi:MAG: 3'-5' exonuclease domain-containing protein 2 [Bacteroidales bacterium]|nr:3'-5' exonuclease domain-containing protein 2 [Bacteroidales bacterium]